MFRNNRLPLQFKLVTFSLIIQGSIALWLMAHAVSQNVLKPNINLFHVVGMFHILALFIGLGLLSLRPRSRTFALSFVKTERAAISLLMPFVLMFVLDSSGMHNLTCSIYPSSCDFLGTVIEMPDPQRLLVFLYFMMFVAFSLMKADWQARVLGRFHRNRA